MYKKQLRFQKIICMLCLIAAAVTFVYSLGILTDIYDGLYLATDPKKPTDDGRVAGSTIYYQMQTFNQQFVKFSIVLILLGAFLFLMNTNIRRKYYIGNYVSIGLYSVASVACVVWSHIQITAFRFQYLTTVDFEALKELCEMKNKPFIKSTLMLDLHYVVGGFMLLCVAGLVYNMIWKIRMMREEDALIKAGEEIAV
ncbi:MAG: hypothetical protein IKT52_13355 [Oscillospiraceae bacterium]|nr:hypothetical protein [Oscillospiraceae bacterium]